MHIELCHSNHKLLIQNMSYLSDEDFLRRLYLRLFGRVVDSDGLSNYLQALRSGSSRYDIYKTLRCSDEARRYELFKFFSSDVISLNYRSIFFVFLINFRIFLKFLKGEKFNHFQILFPNIRSLLKLKSRSFSTALYLLFFNRLDNEHESAYVASRIHQGWSKMGILKEIYFSNPILIKDKQFDWVKSAIALYDFSQKYFWSSAFIRFVWLIDSDVSAARSRRSKHTN